MVRVVFDTNIVVSALLQPLGPSAQLLLLALNRSIQLCMTGSIYTEYEEVISHPRFQHSPEIIAGALEAIRETSFWVRPAESVKACSDPDDDIFPECAQAAEADYLVTGNTKHFPSTWAGTRIVPPRWLADQLSPAAPSEKS
jgi:uncharacterized protein